MIRIFVVEDEALIAEDICQTLRQLGYDIAGTAAGGMEAMVAFETCRPDLVLMDIKLAGRIDGIQTTGVIRKRWGIPVVYLTSHSDDATLARAKETGPHGYLLKPFNERDLRTAIEVALRKHELERKLEQRERWFSTTLDSVGDAIIATDEEERVTFMNPLAEEMTGWKREDAINKPIQEVFKLVTADGTSTRSVTSRAVRDGFRVELPARSKLLDRSGGTRDIDDSISPIVDSRGEVLGGVVVFRDITEKLQLERRVALAERLASISTMAASMAHEINNPLSAAVANVDLVAMRLEELAQQAHDDKLPGWVEHGLQEARDALRDAQSAGVRVRRIVHDLRKFSRTDEPAKEALDLPDVLHTVSQLVGRATNNRATIAVHLGITPLVDANEGRLVQVFSNLILNAVQASAGVVSPRVDLSTRTDDLGRAVVEVKDNGRGIRAEELPHIFQPFFTTKPAGEGLGLGLSICQNIVVGMGGELSVQSVPGAGATFRVVLPSAQDPSLKQRVSSVAPPPGRRGRVLVIDDEDIVGRTIERILSRFHDVHVEVDPSQGLSRLARGEEFDVVLCDLTMPVVNGMEVYRRIAAANPDLAARIVFLTGGVLSDEIEEFLQGCSNTALRKPFSVNRLLDVVASHVQ